MKIEEVSETQTICELELMSIDRAAKILHIRPEELSHAMDVFLQSGGRAGLPFISKGKRKVIRAGALKEYLISLERKELVA